MLPVIMSGGSGTRLWPLSREKFPKQFTELFDEPLQNKTLKRLNKLGQPIILTSKILRDFTIKKARQCGFEKSQIIYEPAGRNTAPAMALLCKVLQNQHKENEIVGVFPADHLILKEDVFLQAVELAETCARDKKIVTLGLKPTEPATGYGYIQTDKTAYTYKGPLSSHSVLKFHEKPTLEVAQRFLAAGSYFWNAGIFVFQVSTMIEKFEKYCPQIWDLFEGLKPDLSNLQAIYMKLPTISIDYAIMEHLTQDELLCVPCQPEWSDVGSWDAVANVYEQSGKNKIETVDIHSTNNFVLPLSNKTYSFIDVDDLIVVDTEDALLISKKGSSEKVKSIVERLKKSDHKKVVEEHRFEERPWGRFDILKDSDTFKSKLITVDEGQQISYQSHGKREEHWIITKGSGEVVLNDQVIPVRPGSYVKIPTKSKHRIRNSSGGPLEFVEVQLGSYFGEDDIIRYQDDYLRE